MAAFEGGGVRGAAHAGAYEAAIDAGVRFTQVAGSSAGSIVAALVAAGATPAFVRRKLLETDFNSLQSHPREEDAPFGTPVLPLPRWLKLRLGFWAAALDAGGMYSTADLRAWIETCLREAFQEQQRPLPSRPICFSDLSLPLYIVATDVLHKEPKVWSTATTPGDSVAFAVQASCAIPFYFQPVLSGVSVLIDGGAVSNLPTHVFPALSGHPGRFSDKTLAFRLKTSSTEPQQRFPSGKEYLLGIADSLVNSATYIQQSLQDGVYTVEIDTGEVRSTDFSGMTPAVRETLYERGKVAMNAFVSREREIVGRHRVASQFTGYDERLHAYVHAFGEARSTIWISDTATYWLWFIFPALASAIRRGVEVRMVAGPADPARAADEARRRALLRSMGCDVTEAPTINFTGVLIDYPGDAATAVITSEHGVVGADFQYGNEIIRIYGSDGDLPVIRSLGANMADQVGHSGPGLSGAGHLGLEALPDAELFAALARVRHYENAVFSLDEVSLDNTLRVSQTSIKEYKLLQVANLADELTSAGFELFAPCQFRLPDKTTSIVTPPVVEMTSQGPVLIEGHTRAFYAAQQGRSRFKAVVVWKVQAALPVAPRPFRDLRVSRQTIDVDANMPGFERSLFRNIEAAVHN